ncbi:MAG: hypothetical protein KatS3mg035_0093 [Bacteroidia bacterium]|nr:MAG: hypothetical protein KatS3mg035_0093 [Bacteroidia bacterium]
MQIDHKFKYNVNKRAFLLNCIVNGFVLSYEFKLLKIN